MSKRARGLVLLAGGALLALVALGADPLGLGGYPGVGKWQISGILVGLGVAVAGALDLRRSG